MTTYSIRSTSDEGVYYLLPDWRRQRGIWSKPGDVFARETFKTARGAKASLTALLRGMPEYRTDVFTMVELNHEERSIKDLYGVEVRRGTASRSATGDWFLPQGRKKGRKKT